MITSAWAAQHGPWCGARTRPARCPTCRERVFYFHCKCGSKVFFDELGPEWPKHSCKPDPRNRAGVPVSACGRMEAVSDLAFRRGIRVLLHFTDMRNLRSIAKEGLLGRRLLDERGRDYTYSDPRRLDGMLDCICFSIKHPDYAAMQHGVYDSTNRIRSREGRWVILEVNCDVLGRRDAFFFPRNSGERRMQQFRSSETPPSVPDDFEAMFSGALDYRDPRLRDSEPTNPRAEVLVRGPIAPSWIKRVVVPSKLDVHQVLGEVRKWPIDADPRVFGPRRDQLGAK